MSSLAVLAACSAAPVVATDDIRPAGVGVDEIAPADDPRFESVAAADRWLSDDSPLLVVSVGRDTKAYPLAILARASGGRSYGRNPYEDHEQAGRSSSSGSRASAAPSTARRTWNVFGEAVAGALRGARLPSVPHDDTFWFAWHAFRSSTRILGD